MEVIMKRNELVQRSTPESLVEHVRRNVPALRQTQHHHGETTESIRKASYRGHHIVIRTGYNVEVDGIPLQGHLGVANDGRVHYHGVPNLSFASAVDLVEQLIEAFPEDFQSP
jgi:hypothetical protein